MIKIAALILVGGKSSRMNQDKAFVLYEGKPLLQRVHEVAVSCSQKVYILTPWPERYQSVLTGNYEVILETQPNQGPLVALAEGLLQIPCDWVWLLGCDLPLLQPEVIKTWQTHLTAVPDGILAVVPQRQLRWEPLCGFYRPSAYPDLQQFIAKGGRSFQEWLTQVPVEPILLSGSLSQMLLNCNTPYDIKP